MVYFQPSGSDQQGINTFIPKRALTSASRKLSLPGSQNRFFPAHPFKVGRSSLSRGRPFRDGWSDGGGAFRAPLKLIYYLERPQVGRRGTWNASTGLGRWDGQAGCGHRSLSGSLQSVEESGLQLIWASGTVEWHGGIQRAKLKLELKILSNSKQWVL